jgi:hypothetical protein
MCRYILTDKDREKLLKWLDTDEEYQQTLNLLSQLKKNILRISEDRPDIESHPKATSSVQMVGKNIMQRRVRRSIPTRKI